MKRFKKVGVVGQGFIGKPLADWQESQGFEVVRYGLEAEYIESREKIRGCDIVFICVPTPTINGENQDHSAILDALSLCSEGVVVVIKSTVMPGTVGELRKVREDLKYVVCPEFLDAATARKDTMSPRKVVIGVDGVELEGEISMILRTIPSRAGKTYKMSCDEACMVKYAHNGFFYIKNVFFNMMSDLANEEGCDFGKVVEAVVADERVGAVHTKVGDKGGRGAGGQCLVKDFAVLSKRYSDYFKEKGDKDGVSMMLSVEAKNLGYLRGSDKDIDIVKEVYGR